MGANFSNAVGGIPEPHARIYKNLIHIQNPATRVQMIETLLAGQEYVATAKKCGLYGPILTYVASIRRGDSALLPGEQAGAHQQQIQVQQSRLPQQQPARLQQRRQVNETSITTRVGDPDQHTKAISFFTHCLQTLGLQEEVALNEETLKAAYKKASLRAHPDKGGSEEAFQAVTRAYAYLGDLLRRMRGGRETTVDVAKESPSSLNTARDQNAESWKMGEPVRLNPKNLDMNVFNRVFEENRMPDPEDDGYGDWLKGGENGPAGGSNSRFSGQFNRDVFNQAFESEVRSRATGGNQLSMRQPEALTMAPTMGIELGRDRPDSFTAANLNGFKYTDLKQAYTTDSTFSHQVAGVNVQSRSFDSMASERKSAPTPLTSAELDAIAEGERQMKLRMQAQATRIQDEDRRVADHFARVQRLVITDAKPLDSKRPLPIQNGGGANQAYRITNH